MQYQTGNPKWQEAWEEFWESRFKEIDQFVVKLTKNMGKSSEKRKTVQSAIAHFKKGEDVSRIKHFLENQQRRDAFLHTLEISVKELDEYLQQINENSQAPAIDLYRNFPIELPSADEGWIEPMFFKISSQHGPTRMSFGDLRSLLEGGQKIVLIQASCGKTRLLEYFNHLSHTKTARFGGYNTEYAYFQEEISSPQKSNSFKSAVFLLDVANNKKRRKLIELFRARISGSARPSLFGDMISDARTSLLIMVNSSENLEDIKENLGLPKDDKKNSESLDIIKKNQIECWRMEILLGSREATKVIETIRKNTKEAMERTILPQLRDFIEKQSCLTELPSWCSTLDYFTSFARVMVDSGDAMDMSQYTWDSLLPEVLCLKISRLLPHTLTDKKRKVKKVLACFAACWLQQSFDTHASERRRYKNSVLIFPDEEIVRDLWLDVTISKKGRVDLPLIRDLWQDLDADEVDIENLREKLWTWKTIDREALLKTFLRFPLWQEIPETHYNSRREEPITGRWFRHILTDVEPELLRPVFPHLLYHYDDDIIDNYAILELFFRAHPDQVNSALFRAAVAKLPPPESNLLILTAAAATDLIEEKKIVAAWEYIFDWWNNLPPRPFTENAEAFYWKDIGTRGRETYPQMVIFFARFIARHVDRLRLISQKYREILPPYNPKTTTIAPLHNSSHRADWYQWTKYRLERQATDICIDTINTMSITSREERIPIEKGDISALSQHSIISVNLKTGEREGISYESESEIVKSEKRVRPDYRYLSELEIEPVEWLAQKGNQQALDILSGENGGWFLSSAPEVCKKYLGRGSHGWEFEKLPHILLHYYLQESQREDWYCRLPDPQRKTFFVKLLSEAGRPIPHESVANVFSLVRGHNPEFLTSSAVSNLAFSSSLPIKFTSQEKHHAGDHLAKFLDSASAYLDPQAFDRFLEKILLSITDIENKEISLMETVENPRNLEMGCSFLIHYAQKIPKHAAFTFQRFLYFLENFARLTFEHFDTLPDTKEGREKFLLWFYQVFRSGYNLRTEEKAKNEEKIILAVVLQWGIEVLQKEAIHKISWKRRLAMTKGFWQSLVRCPKRNITGGAFVLANQYLQFPSLTPNQSRQCNKEMMTDLSEHLENETEILQLYMFTPVNIDREQRIYIYREFMPFLAQKNELLYEKWREKLLNNENVREENYLLFIGIKDEIALEMFWQREGNISLLLHIALYYDIVDEVWLTWLVRQVEEKHCDKWPEIFKSFQERYGYTERREDLPQILYPPAIEYLRSLAPEIQVQRLETIVGDSDVFHLIKGGLWPWVVSMLGEQFQAYHPKLLEIVPRFGVEYLGNSPWSRPCFTDNDLGIIENILSQDISWLNWSKDELSFPSLWGYTLKYNQCKLTETGQENLYKWGCRQIKQMIAASLSIWDARTREYLWNVVLGMLPEKAEETYRESYSFVVENYGKLPQENLALGNSLNIVVKNLVVSGQEEFIVVGIKRLLSLYSETKNESWLWPLFAHIIPRLYEHNPNSDIFLQILQDTVKKPLPFFNSPEIPIDAVTPLFLSTPQAQKALEFYLTRYISTQDLARLIRYYWYGETMTNGLISWKDWPETETRYLPDGFPEACQQLGAQITEIVEKRCKKSPKEKVLWRTLIFGVYHNHPQKQQFLTNFGGTI